MNRRGAGVSFCCISAFLYSIKYLSAAIYYSTNRSAPFKDIFNEIGYSLDIISIISLIAGIIYIVISEKVDYIANKE